MAWMLDRDLSLISAGFGLHLAFIGISLAITAADWTLQRRADSGANGTAGSFALNSNLGLVHTGLGKKLALIVISDIICATDWANEGRTDLLTLRAATILESRAAAAPVIVFSY